MSRPGCFSMRISALWALACWALAALVAGCTGPAHTQGRPLPDARPGDFTLGLTVHGPDSGVRTPGEVSARYLVTADGWLRTAVGPGARESVHPKRTRLLDARQRDTLWAMVRATGIEHAEPPRRIESPESFVAPAGRRIYLVQLNAEGRRVSIVAAAGEPESGPVADLADRLAAWSWVEP